MTSTNSLTSDSSSNEAMIISDEIPGTTNLRGTETNSFMTSPKHSVTRSKKKCRLIRKSPLKLSPIKNLNHIFRKHKRKSKAKVISPRKHQFILPKVKFNSKTGKYQRNLKPKSLPKEKLKPQENQSCHEEAERLLGNANQASSSDSGLTSGEAGNSRDENDACKAPVGPDEDVEEDNEDEEVEDAEQVQQEEHLAAFLKASSTIASQKAGERRGAASSREQKLTKHQKRIQARINALSHAPDLKAQQEALVLNYLIRVRDSLTPLRDAKFEEFLSALNGISSHSEPVEKVYFKVMDILKDYPDLQEGFVMFLKPDQAIRVGRFPQYCLMHHMREFTAELKHQFSNQTQNMQKVLKALQSLMTEPNISSEQLTAALTPVFKLQPWLIQSLSQCIPSAKPEPSPGDDFEEINLEQPQSPDGFEHINLIDDDAKTATESCPCRCHSDPDPRATSALAQSFKSDHCLSCGLRFIDGRVYLQCGKTLRLAKVTYLSKGKEEASGRVSCKAKDEKAPKRDLKQSCSERGGKVARVSHKGVEGADADKPKKGRKAKKS